MVAIVLQHRYKKAPSAASRLDFSNPLTDRAEFLLSGPHNAEVVHGMQRVLGTAVKRDSTRIGPGWASTASSTGINLGIPAGAAVDLAVRPSTFIFYGSVVTGGNMAAAERNDGNTVGAGWSFNGILLIERASVNLQAGIASPSGIGAYTYVLTNDGSLTAAGIKVYLNGQFKTNTANTNGSGAVVPSDVSRTLYVGRSNFGTSFLNGYFGMVGAFGRVWDSAEAKSFAENPWQLFRQRNRVVYSIPASAGAGGARPVVFVST